MRSPSRPGRTRRSTRLSVRASGGRRRTPRNVDYCLRGGGPWGRCGCDARHARKASTWSSVSTASIWRSTSARWASRSPPGGGPPCPRCCAPRGGGPEARLASAATRISCTRSAWTSVRSTAALMSATRSAMRPSSRAVSWDEAHPASERSTAASAMTERKGENAVRESLMGVGGRTLMRRCGPPPGRRLPGGNGQGQDVTVVMMDESVAFSRNVPPLSVPPSESVPVGLPVTVPPS